MEEEQSNSSKRLDDFQSQMDKIESQECLIHKTIQHVQSTVNTVLVNTAVVTDDGTLRRNKIVDEPEVSVKQNPMKEMFESINTQISCDHCDFVCSSSGVLKQHKKQNHLQRCDKCDFVIHNDEQRKKHIKTDMKVKMDSSGWQILLTQMLTSVSSPEPQI